MSDLFGNPEDRFSRVAAHMMPELSMMDAVCLHLFKLCNEKTCLRGL